MKKAVDRLAIAVYIGVISKGKQQMIKEYQVEVKAIKMLRKKARIEMWYDRINDGKITWK